MWIRNAVERGESLQEASNIVKRVKMHNFYIKVAQRAYYEGKKPSFDSSKDNKIQENSIKKK